MFDTILLTVDVNDLKGSVRPAEAAMRMAKAEGAVLHVANVVPDFGMSIVGSYFDKSHNKQILADAKKALEDWANERFREFGPVKLHVDQGTIYDRVLKVAERIDAKAIVVGAHKSQLQDYLIGPNASRIARHAAQSVFVVR